MPPKRNRPRGSLLPLSESVNLSASGKTTLLQCNRRIFAARQIRKTYKKMRSENEAKLRTGLKGYVEVDFSNSIHIAGNIST